jgi:N-acetylmannosamine-6-phosphate 2-epimerase/N-acetylmannosamine kinase
MSEPVLAIDVGGTKMLAVLVEGASVMQARTIPTPRQDGPEAWCDALADLVSDWRGRFGRVGLALTGGVAGGRWFALNPDTLPVPAGFPVVEAMRRRLDVPVHACNDAQAAAWGEYRHGAGRGRDIVFLTVSTGLGGGVVSGGQLLTGRSGLGGHVGQIRLASADGSQRLEDMLAGRAIARAAAGAGHPVEAAAVVEAGLLRNEPWAARIIGAAADLLARAIADLQLLFDTELVVMGGGLGLNQVYRERVARALGHLPDALRPTLVPAELGVNAGAIGVADLASRKTST